MENTTAKKSSKAKVKDICFTAVMGALIFAFTYTFKIPMGAGYTHIGDSIIFLSIALIGSKRSSLAAGIGAALADLIGGYTVWVLPTLIIKSVMALICGLFAEKIFKNKTVGYFVGCILGGVFQIFGYSVARTIIYDFKTAIASLPTLTLQTVVGFVVAIVLIVIFNKSGATNKLKKLAELD